MSHVSTYGQKIMDKQTFCRVAAGKGYAVRILNEGEKVQLYGSNRVEAYAEIKIEGWRFPVALANDGTLKYDHFGSKQGTMELLGELTRDYNLEIAMKNVPYDEIVAHHTRHVNDGIELVLEYE